MQNKFGFKPLQNPLLISGIISKETANILFPPDEEILPGRKRPLRIQSKARVMTADDVIEDLATQREIVLSKQQKKNDLAAKRKEKCLAKSNVNAKRKKRSGTAQPKRTNKVVKNSNNDGLEENHCYICDINWEDASTESKLKWAVCENDGCPRWICPNCLAPEHDYDAEYICIYCMEINEPLVC